MSASNSFETAILKLIFNATTYNNIAENDSTSPLTNLYISLHTASPGDNGTAITNEAAYTNYARVALIRTTAGWTVTDDDAVNLTSVVFPACGATGAVITHFGIVETASGAGELYFSGEANLAVVQDMIPTFAPGVLKVNVN